MAVMALALILLVGFFTLLLIVKNVLYVCQPSEVLVFSGRFNADEGRKYRIIKGGRAVRWPILETVDKMDLTNMIIEVAVKGAYCKGGIPLAVHGVANVKLPGEAPLIHNALERHLGKSREEIMQIARETLEGNLRGVLATLTPEQVNQDKEAFAEKLAVEAEHDLSRIGLVLDTLKIQNVTDDVGYLSAIGRTRSAQIRRNAQIAEANAQAEAAEVKWQNYMQGELAKLDAQINVARKENERRIADARTRREAMIAEQKAAVQAAIAQAKAEIQMQTARIEQVKLQLQADVIQPAEAQREQQIASARAEASKTIEQGKAMARVLTDLATSYRASGNSARDVLLMQKLVPLLQTMSSTIGALRIDKLTIIGKSGSADAGVPLASRIVNASEQIKAATGVDVPRLLQQKLGTGGPAATIRAPSSAGTTEASNVPPGAPPRGGYGQ